VLSIIIGVVHTSFNLRRDIWLRDVISRFENLPDGCLYWVNHVDPLAALSQKQASHVVQICDRFTPESRDRQTLPPGAVGHSIYSNCDGTAIAARRRIG
jgi:hypothetical protein